MSKQAELGEGLTSNSERNGVAASASWMVSSVSAVLLVFVAPIGILGSGYFQLFQPIGWVDPGIDVGYELDYVNLQATYGSTYFLTRLPFLLPAIGFHQILPHELANISISMFFTIIGSAGLLALLYPRLGLWPAGVAVLWLVLNPRWVAAIARGYVDGPVSAMVFLALAALLNRNIVQRKRLLIFAGGCLSALAFYTHPAAALIIALALSGSFVLERQTFVSVVSDAAIALAGFIFCTLVLAVTSHFLGGKFWFFLSDMHAIRRSFVGFGENYRYALVEWTPKAYRLLPPFVLCVIVAVYMRRGSSGRIVRATAITGMCMVLGVGAFLVFWDYVIGGATLQTPFYSSYMLPGQALIIGAIAGRLPRFEKRLEIHLLGACVVVAAIAIYSRAAEIWNLVQFYDPSGLRTWWVLAVIFGVAFAFLSLQRTAVALAFVILGTVFSATLNADTRRIFMVRDGIDYRTTYRTTLRIFDIVQKVAPAGERKLFWYNRETLTRAEADRAAWALYKLRFRTSTLVLNYWDSATSIWLWDRSALGWNLPALDAASRDLLNCCGPTTLITFCMEPSECTRATDELRRLGYKVEDHQSTRIDDTGYLPFWLYTFHVASKAK